MDLSVGDEVLTSKSSQSQTSTNNSSSSDVDLGKVINSKQMIIPFPVDEVDIAKVKIGQQAEVTVDALEDKVFQGKVTEIAEEGVVTNNVSSFEVTIQLDNPENILKSGMTSNVTISVAKQANALLIPIEAVQEMGKRKFVLIPSSGASEQNSAGSKQDSAASQQRGNRQPVTVGLTNESFAEITAGLQEGDKVLLPGLQTNANNARGMILPGMGGGRARPAGGGG